MLYKKTLFLFFIILNITCSVICQRNYTNVYYMKNHVLGLSEELKVDSVEEDKYFSGGKDVKHWLKLPSVSVLYLIGIKQKGLSLITITKKISTPFYQAVEKQIDVGDNITSTVAFKSYNYELQKMEDLVIISTDSEKNEIILYKIQNYKLVKFWVWKRYAKVQSLLQFTVMREDRLLLVDSDGITGYLYKFNIDKNSVHIRELEVINFSEKTSRISVSILFPEPYMYAVQDGKLAIYRYIRFCPESWIGEFIKQTSFEHLEVTDALPFHSNGREYLAVAGKLGGILRVDASDKFVQEVQIDNVIEWLVIHSGPEKENTLLFCKTEETIYIFYNSGFGWKTQVNPSCYKYDEQNKRIITKTNLGCLKEKKWSGAVSLDFGQLPTLIFGERKFIGEMYHIMLSIKRHILSMEELNDDNKDYGNYLSKMRSNLKDLVGVINKEDKIESTCSIVGMLTEIENIAAKAKEKVSNSCPAHSSIPTQRIASLNEVDKNVTIKEVQEKKTEHIPSYEVDDSEDINHLNSKLLKPPMHLISPDMEVRAPRFQDLGVDISMTGFSKKQENII
ncbi:unnamed protein product [Nezara viridula]|uniref:Uncharacterized protein n=1 Tax=Nezara viridula TaxID=85310 RepID=A0A9P0HH05_NEZVI|nr:unnamed protein product [Nezara viridula]